MALPNLKSKYSKIAVKTANKSYKASPRRLDSGFNLLDSIEILEGIDISRLTKTKGFNLKTYISKELTKLEKDLDSSEINSFGATLNTEQEFKIYCHYLDKLGKIIQKKDLTLGNMIIRGVLGCDKIFKKLNTSLRAEFSTFKPSVIEIPKKTIASQTEKIEELQENEELSLSPELKNLSSLAAGFDKIKISRVSHHLAELYDVLKGMHTEVPSPTEVDFGMPEMPEITEVEKSVNLQLTVIKKNINQIIRNNDMKRLAISKETQTESDERRRTIVALEEMNEEKEMDLFKIKALFAKVNDEKRKLEEGLLRVSSINAEFERKLGQNDIEISHLKQSNKILNEKVLMYEARIIVINSALDEIGRKNKIFKDIIKSLKITVRKKQSQLQNALDQLYSTQVIWKITEKKLNKLEKEWEKQNGSPFQFKDINIDVVLKKQGIKKICAEDIEDELHFSEEEELENLDVLLWVDKENSEKGVDQHVINAHEIKGNRIKAPAGNKLGKNTEKQSKAYKKSNKKLKLESDNSDSDSVTKEYTVNESKAKESLDISQEIPKKSIEVITKDQTNKSIIKNQPKISITSARHSSSKKHELLGSNNPPLEPKVKSKENSAQASHEDNKNSKPQRRNLSSIIEAEVIPNPLSPKPRIKLSNLAESIRTSLLDSLSLQSFSGFHQDQSIAPPIKLGIPTDPSITSTSRPLTSQIEHSSLPSTCPPVSLSTLLTSQQTKPTSTPTHTIDLFPTASPRHLNHPRSQNPDRPLSRSSLPPEQLMPTLTKDISISTEMPNVNMLSSDSSSHEKDSNENLRPIKPSALKPRTLTPSLPRTPKPALRSRQVSISLSKDTENTEADSYTKELIQLEKHLISSFNSEQNTSYNLLKSKEGEFKIMKAVKLSKAIQCSLLLPYEHDDKLQKIRNKEKYKKLLEKVFEFTAEIDNLAPKFRIELAAAFKGHKNEKCGEVCEHLKKAMLVKLKARGNPYPLKVIKM